MRHASATEEPPITNDMINLHTLMEKTPDADLLREMIGFAAQRLMELEVEGQTGAYGEKSPERLPQRNDDLRPDLGEPAPMASNCASPSCARAPASPVSGIPPHGREGAHRQKGRRATYRLLAAFLILKSSIRLPEFNCATSQRGCLPRPAQVSEG